MLLQKAVLGLHSRKVCRRASQSLGAEFEKALEPNCFFRVPLTDT